MTTPRNTRRRILPLALLAAATTLALTACGGASGSGANAAGSGASASAPASAAPSGGVSAGTTGGSTSAAPHSSGATGGGSGGGSGSQGSSSGGSGTTGNPISSGGGNGSSDSYAYRHPCTADQLSTKVSYDAQLGVTKRLIAVTDTGSAACGLSYYPVVAIDNSSSVNNPQGTVQTVQPKVPSGLGGAPYYALYAGQTAYAVVDLDPSHSTAGAGRAYDELSVIPTDSLPDADSVESRIVEEGGGTGNPYVAAPFLGLYESSVSAAAGSANPGNG
ncbi:DUF4232 domain-containing protein [Streptacidiphilus sp. P02-A3a]|uniref:DUF4232 domain-containing protein n=1 Tax=Streptacidiphilus sp. P02-A3a TaxID=2704468 RepID=UPI0015F79835|nr:DUF4232 domain-containing protein [Streptacidiphilus sp. P02-A3a]QMU72403.1 DUF4232 domain-containing protein [Streptacidiphilus sp. P02-A3a]